jgi:hypothetical protein
MKAHNNFRFLAIVLLVIQLLVVSCSAPTTTTPVLMATETQYEPTLTPAAPLPTPTLTPTVFPAQVNGQFNAYSFTGYIPGNKPDSDGQMIKPVSNRGTVNTDALRVESLVPVVATVEGAGDVLLAVSEGDSFKLPYLDRITDRETGEVLAFSEARDGYVIYRGPSGKVQYALTTVPRIQEASAAVLYIDFTLLEDGRPSGELRVRQYDDKQQKIADMPIVLDDQPMVLEGSSNNVTILIEGRKLVFDEFNSGWKIEPTPTPRPSPTPEAWVRNPDYFKATFFTSDGRLRFPPPGFRTFDNMKTFEVVNAEFEKMIEGGSLMSVDSGNPVELNAWGQLALKLVPEAISAGWRGAIDCGECQLGIGQGRLSTGVSIDSEYGVYPLALARVKAGSPDDYIGLYLVNHDGNYSAIFLKMEGPYAYLWINTYNKSNLYFNHETDTDAQKTLQILKDIAHGKRSGVVADWVFTLAGSDR